MHVLYVIIDKELTYESQLNKTIRKLAQAIKCNTVRNLLIGIRIPSVEVQVTKVSLHAFLNYIKQTKD